MKTHKPNKTTARVLRNADKGVGLETFSSIEEFLRATDGSLKNKRRKRTKK